MQAKTTHLKLLESERRSVNNDYTKATCPVGHKVRKQMEAAAEMGLTEEDLRCLSSYFPGQYDDLMIAMGYAKPNRSLQ